MINGKTKTEGHSIAKFNVAFCFWFTDIERSSDEAVADCIKYCYSAIQIRDFFNCSFWSHCSNAQLSKGPHRTELTHPGKPALSLTHSGIPLPIWLDILNLESWTVSGVYFWHTQKFEINGRRLLPWDFYINQSKKHISFLGFMRFMLEKTPRSCYKLHFPFFFDHLYAILALRRNCFCLENTVTTISSVSLFLTLNNFLLSLK